jgi:hypothetical protein
MPAVTGVTNNGVILRGLANLPSATEMLTVDPTGVMGRQAIPVGAFGSLTGFPSDNAALAAALAGKVSLSGDTMTGQLNGTTAVFSSFVQAGAVDIPQNGSNWSQFSFSQSGVGRGALIYDPARQAIGIRNNNYSVNDYSLYVDGNGALQLRNGATYNSSPVFTVTPVGAVTASGLVRTPAGDYFNAGLEIGSNLGMYDSSGLVVRYGGQECFQLNQSELSMRSSVEIGWTGTTAATGAVESKFVRSGGGQVDYRGNGGFRFRNLANSANTPIAASRLQMGPYSFGGYMDLSPDNGDGWTFIAARHYLRMAGDTFLAWTSNNDYANQPIRTILKQSSIASAGLGVYGSDGSSPAPFICGSLTASGAIAASSGTALVLNTNANERMRIDTNGNVGFGSTNPNVGLVIRRSGTDLPSLRLEDGDVTVPMTGLAINPSLNANTVSAWSASSSVSGGAQMNGFCNNAAGAIPLSLIGYSGSNAPTAPCIGFTGNKSNGGTGVADLSGTELIAGFYAGNGAATPVVTVAANGAITANHALRLATDNTGLYFGPSGNTHRLSSFGTDLYYDVGAAAGRHLFRSSASTSSLLTLETTQNTSHRPFVAQSTIVSNGTVSLRTATNDLVRLTSVGGEGTVLFGNNTNTTTALIYTTSASANLRFTVGGNNRLDIDGTTVNVNNANLSVNGGTLTHGFQPLVANPSTVDITNGLIRAVKNTTSGELRIWANDGNVMKSMLFS